MLAPTLLALSLMLCALPSYGAEVISVTPDEKIFKISQDSKHRWSIEDTVCISRNENEVACGEVILATPTEATVKLKAVIPVKNASKRTKRTRLTKKDLPKKGDAVLSPQMMEAKRLPIHINIYISKEGKVESSEASQSGIHIKSEPRATTPGAADLQELALSPPESGCPFQPSESLCIYSLEETNARSPACGTLVRKGNEKVILSVPRQSGVFEPGNYRLSRGKARARTPTAVDSKEIYRLDDRPYAKWDASLGFLASSHIFIPEIQFLRTIGRGFGVGLRVLYANDFDTEFSLRFYGFYATAAYYFRRQTYSGLFAQAGMGVFLFNAADSVRSEKGRTALAGFLSGGWDWAPFPFGLNIKLAAGLQYMGSPNVTVLQTGVTGLLPFFSLTLGYSF